MQYKILAVDDNPINLKLITKYLSNANYQIITADCGKEALKAAFKERPDIILLDIMMPDMDGYEVCRRLQQREETRYIPVIFLSAKNESVDVARGLAVGAVDYLTKPFDPMEIDARVRTHLAVRKNIIEVIRQNDQLRKKVHGLQNRLESEENQSRVHKYLDQLVVEEVSIENEQIALYSKIIEPHAPVVLHLEPVIDQPDGFVFFTARAFDKSYQGIVVQCRLRSFVRGYVRTLNLDKRLNSEAIERLMNLLVEEFEPKQLGMAVTFSLGYVDYQTRRFLYYAVNQPLPNILTPDSADQVDRGQNLEVNTPYTGLIVAKQFEVSPNALIFLGIDGVQNEIDWHPTDLRFPNNPSVKQLKKIVDQISKDFSSPGNDRLVMLASLKTRAS